ncbi:response regulator transcription factor [Plantactinospora sonchi]|uniref:Response regulator transcription factor n=1 Tax=Plantactinospora sonchi TaxID=1544735 RepID=A0ABU7RZC5_9ACTN
MTPIRVVLVDDQHLVRTGLRALLERTPEITVVGEAGDGATGLAVVREQRPDIVLMDVRMPGTDGLTATRRILTDPGLADVRVVMLTTFDDDEYLFEAIRAGAAGFLLKDTPPDALREAVRVVADGNALLSPAVTRRVLAAVARTPLADPGRLAGLTERERDVLAQVGAGRSNAEIGAALFLSPETARTYVSRLLAKLHARDRAQLVVIAYETGLVRPGET